jgi:serine phosphatase RsbU (regulator of sigma subunit)/CBS domain-containing protein
MSLKETLDEVMVSDVLTATADMKTSEAIRLMASRRAGSIVVVSGEKPIGIFTERDLIYKVVLPKLNAESVPVSAVMTNKLVSLQRNNTIEDAYKAMQGGNFRHLLVLDHGKIVGIASIKDLIKFRGKILEQMVEEQTAEILRVNTRLESELDAKQREIRSAGKFQKELVGKRHPKFKNVKITQLYEQESTIGGDFFEVIRIKHNHVGIFMADVMGHGITSAIIAIELKLKFEQFSRDNLSTSDVAGRLNNALIPLMPDSYFVAGFYGLVNLDTLRMNYTQFGLPKPTLLHGKSMRTHPLTPMNMPLGFRKGSSYKSGDVTIHPGDRLLLFTDGSTEQKNNKGKFFGEDRFVGLFKKFVCENERNIVKRLYQEVLCFADGRPITDDIAILLCEFT